MITVTGKVTDVAGGPVQKGTRVSVRPSGFCWIPGALGQEIVLERVYLDVSDTGEFSVDLFSNSELVPSGSFYVLEFTTFTGNPIVEVAFVVPSSGGPYQIGDLITSTPPVPAQYVVGPKGDPGGVGAQTLEVAAGHDMSAHRAVVQLADDTIVYADPTNPDHLTLPIWLSLTAASIGEQVEVLIFGETVEPTWNWIPGGSIFIGLNGVLTQNYVAHAWVRTLGAALDSTTVFWNPAVPLVLV